MSKIEWTDVTWNPITGCSKISEGCANCYAERMAHRLAGRCGYPEAPNQFKPTFHKDILSKPLSWRKPRMVFVCSMGDLFHESVPVDWIYEVFRVMEMCQQHTFMLLTKRPEQMRRMIMGVVTGYAVEHRKNIWLGVTAENQRRADERIPILLQIPAAVRFVSVEPMLDPVLLTDMEGPDIYKRRWLEDWIVPGGDGSMDTLGLDWVICGAETGPGKRGMRRDWARALRDQCVSADVPFFFKKDSTGSRLLDGRMWEQMPEAPK